MYETDAWNIYIGFSMAVACAVPAVIAWLLASGCADTVRSFLTPLSKGVCIGCGGRCDNRTDEACASCGRRASELRPSFEKAAADFRYGVRATAVTLAIATLAGSFAMPMLGVGLVAAFAASTACLMGVGMTIAALSRAPRAASGSVAAAAVCVWALGWVCAVSVSSGVMYIGMGLWGLLPK